MILSSLVLSVSHDFAPDDFAFEEFFPPRRLCLSKKN
jgi:hypothetical protein